VIDPSFGTRRRTMVSARRPWLTAVVCGLLCGPAFAQGKPEKLPAPGPAPTPAPKAPVQVPEGNEATVNGQAISRKAIFRALKRVPPGKQAEERFRVLNFLIDNVLIDQEMVRMAIQVETKGVDARVNDIKAEIKKNKKDFDK